MDISSFCKSAMVTLPLLTVLLTMVPAHVEAKSDKVVCYYSSWAHYRTGSARYTVEDIPIELCSHVIYAFAVLDPVSLKMVEHDSYLDKDDGLANYRRFVELRQKNPNAKMLLGLGGWTDSRTDKYSRLVSSTDSRAIFVSHAVQFLREYGFDGLDLDWEYPAYESTADDKEGFRLWVEELQAAFKPHGLLLTAAVSAGKNVIDRGYDVPAVAAALDQIHIMAYDFHGAWERRVNHHAPLFPVAGEPEELSADYAVRHWIKKGAKPSQLILGVPFYGRSWTLAGSESSPGAAATGPGMPGPLMRDAGTMAYYEICAVHEKENWVKYSTPAGPYLTKDNQWVGYDDIESIVTKTEYTMSLGLGGVMIWDLPMDDFLGTCRGGVNPLLNAITATLKGEQVSTRPTSPSKPQTTRPTTVEASTSMNTSPNPSYTTATKPTPTTPKPGQIDLALCKSTGYAPNPSDCSIFYRCVGEEIYLFQCPGGLYWNQEQRNCDWPENTHCKMRPFGVREGNDVYEFQHFGYLTENNL